MGFSKPRQGLNLTFPCLDNNNIKLESYKNVSSLIGMIVSKRLATLHELDTIYSFEDALDLYEIIYVDSYNQAIECEASYKK